MNRFYQRTLLALLSALTILTHSAFGAVLAIDYGTDWIKASLMKPGIPFDVLLNKDSKRKIQASVAWKGDDRLFGADAANIAGRFPTESFSSLKLLLGAPYDSGALEFYTTVSSAEVTKTSRGTVALKRKDGAEWTVEELVAMQFSYVKDLAESLANEKVYDTIVTVPPYYSQGERDAVADAIEISGLRTLALINDGTAVAINYAMTREFPKQEYHVIYDAGASAIRATVASFGTVEGKGKGKESTQITVHGVGYDRSTGGIELDRRLRDLLANDFARKHGKDLRRDKRGMARLWKETSRVKAILSANSESRVTVESIAWDIDYKSKITRAEFEKACADLKPRYAKPIVDALNAAGITLDDVTSVILTGGSSRTPMIKDAVQATVGKSKIAVNVNADEAAVLGAALHGASLSRQFKTKEIKVSDVSVHDVQASYPSEKGSKMISTVIFPANARLNTRKVMTFKRKDDFPITLSHKTPPALSFPTEILEAKIVGVAEALQNLTDMGAIEPVVKATLQLSESGFAAVKEAHAVGEVKESLTGSSSSTESASETAGESASSATASASSKLKEERIPLTLDVKFLGIPPVALQDKRASRNKLIAIDSQESSKRAKEDARNTLEGYLYRVRDLLDDDRADAPFVKCSKDAERREISRTLEATFSWLNEEGDHAETNKLIEKRSALEKLERPIVHRYKEIEEFPKALNNSQMWNWSTRLFITEAKQNLTAEENGDPDIVAKVTKEEIADLEAKLKEHETWLNIGVEKQKSKKYNDDPAIETSEMHRRAEELSKHLHKLVKRKAPVRRKTSTSGSASAKATETPTPVQNKKHDEL